MNAQQCSMALPILAVLLAAACDRDPTPIAPETATDEAYEEHLTRHFDPTYACPMHPQILRDAPGTCPICGMELMPVKPDDSASDSERSILYYRHPHNPAIVSERPMQDEMGMDYVPVYDDGGGAGVRISPEVVNNLGVRTAAAERGDMWKRIDTVGYVAYDESRVSHIHTRAEGWIERLRLQSVGERVAAGQILFELYAPALATAQQEYLQALTRGNSALIQASEVRLRALGIPGDSIEQLKKTRQPDPRIRFRSQADAVVTRLDVREGMYVTPATMVVSLADLSAVWVIAEVFERQADWIATGRPAEMRLSSQPGRVWEGEVEFVYPDLDARTRTLQVRLRFDNPGEVLKPNMFAEVTLYGGPESDVVHIPIEALIRGGRSDRVILAQGDGRFQPRDVVAGLESGGRVEIKAGLDPGDRVVTSGQFLIDSEASLRQSLERLRSADHAATPNND